MQYCPKSCSNRISSIIYASLPKKTIYDYHKWYIITYIGVQAILILKYIIFDRILIITSRCDNILNQNTPASKHSLASVFHVYSGGIRNHLFSKIILRKRDSTNIERLKEIIFDHNNLK